MNEILIVLGIILGLVLTGVLNRLRGTGLIKYFGILNIVKYNIEIKLVWNHIFGLYYGIIFGIVSGLWYVGLLVAVLYFIGESKGWGEWIGVLTRWEIKDEQWLEKQYKDDEGKKFPFIHQIANFIVKEKIDGDINKKLTQYNKYANTALVIRGIYWFIGIEIVNIIFGLIPYYIGLLSIITIGFLFPVACYLGKITKLNGKIGIINYSRGWENQEIYFGIFQFLIIILPVIIYNYI